RSSPGEETSIVYRPSNRLASSTASPRRRLAWAHCSMVTPPTPSTSRRISCSPDLGTTDSSTSSRCRSARIGSASAWIAASRLSSLMGVPGHKSSQRTKKVGRAHFSRKPYCRMVLQRRDLVKVLSGRLDEVALAGERFLLRGPQAELVFPLRFPGLPHHHLQGNADQIRI